ncbi:D-alanyl-D-alanine carboxypeptidase family protein [Bacillus sp. PS06]|uniref:M15 family metallopeptidase n=1 Tax=Bacillus sp. PS06 TaxID=2764176 RepID=UPI0017876BB6|nr:M15 family metallopeptidase [Bacillus sp. PS06]MBD8068031.1 M15 family metallopeptidase [Bacillus sp. PS06]
MVKRFISVYLLILAVSTTVVGCSQFDLNSLLEHRIGDATKLENEQTTPSETGKDSNANSGNGQAHEEEVDDEWVLEAKFFNEVEISDGLSVILNPENILSLVNKEHTLPSVYSPADLTIPEVEFSFGKQDVPKSYLREEAALALEKMFASANNEGIKLFAVSGYRSYETQEALYNAQIKKTGDTEVANQTVAVPGESEHQTGLAMDVSSKSVNLQLIEEFGETKEGKWVEQNAHKFGFILRFPKGKEDITGYQYEPWHFRYVGEEIASQIYNNNLTLEEFFGKVKKL